MNGLWGIVLAVSVLILYVFILLRVTSGYSDMVRFLGSFWGQDSRGLFFLIYIIFTAVYILKILEQIIPRWLLMNSVRVGFFSCDSCVQYRNRKGNSEKRTDGGDIRRPASGRCSSYDGAVSGADTG